MAYNITNLKIKKLENFKVPLNAFYESEDERFRVQGHTISIGNKIVIEGICEQTIKGTINEGLITITELDLTGEGSGTFKRSILNEAFKQSTGQLEVIIVWEGGHSITNYVVNNGLVTETEVEL